MKVHLNLMRMFWNKQSSASSTVRIAAVFLISVLCFSLTSCQGSPVKDAAAIGVIGTVSIPDAAVPLAGGTKVLKPETGSTTYSGGGATIDASNTSEGYVMIKYSGGSKKIKVQISRGGKGTYTYNLTPGGKFEVFPLTAGNGSYTIGVFTNVSGTQYMEALKKNVTVKLRSSTLPFLYPSQYVNFNAKSKTVAKGEELAKGAANDLEVVEKVYNYVVGNISYDTAKAKSVQSGYLPAVDSILSSKKGICFDYAAVMAAMLRSQQIPTRLEVGYVSNGAYHAWVSVYIKDVGWVNGVIQFDGKNWKLMDPTFASSGGGSSDIMKYIGNGSNYKIQYIY